MNPALDIATSTERVEPAHRLRCTEPCYDPGGGGINVARALHALGGEAAAVFPVGGPAGEMIRDMLVQEGVAHHPIAVASFTRASLAVEERATGNQFRFILPGPEISERDQQRCPDQLALLAAGARFIVANGSLPLGVPQNFHVRGASLAQSLGKPLILDTSDEALRKSGSGFYLMKPSLRELQDLVGREIRTEREQERAAMDMIALGRCGIVVVSLGSEAPCWRPQTGPSGFRRSWWKRKGPATACWLASSSAFPAACPLRQAVSYGMAAGAAALLGFGTACVVAPMSSDCISHRSPTIPRNDLSPSFAGSKQPRGSSVIRDRRVKARQLHLSLSWIAPSCNATKLSALAHVALMWINIFAVGRALAREDRLCSAQVRSATSAKPRL
jgi:6-phosphofructokinase 2